MTTYQTRRGAYTYGQAVGILLLDAKAPFIPGDVANATSYDYPVIYKTVEGLSTSVCLNGAPEFHEAVAEAVDIPVCMSSLLQLPFIARSLDPSQPIGVITADSTNLDEGFLTRGGIKLPPNPLIIRGMQDEPEFKTAVLEEKGTLDSDLITAETVACAEKLLAEYPTMGAILLECSMLPPYAKAVQDAVGLPVYDFISAIDYLSAGMRPRAYTGGY
jgi:hypothetical protein